MIEEHDVVALTEDLPEETILIGESLPEATIRAGAVGTVVFIYEGRKVYEVEFVDTAALRWWAVAEVEAGAVRPLTEQELNKLRP